MKTWPLCTVLLTALLAGCGTTTTVDEFRLNSSPIEFDQGAKMVLLGRRDSGHYETDREFVSCLGNKVKNRDLQVIPEDDFLDALYPWFEPRTAPKGLKRLQRILQEPLIRNTVNDLNIRFLVWLNGSTETKNSGGSISCAVGPGGGGCLGFASWDKISSYEAIIWDVKNGIEQGRIRVDSEGTSYLIGAGAPIPLLTPVHSDACSGLSKQLRSFFSKSSQKTE